MNYEYVALPQLIINNLPKSAKWDFNGFSCEYRFMMNENDYEIIVDDNFDLKVFGRCEYDPDSIAVASIGVRTDNNMIYEFNVDSDIASHVLNSNINKFIETFNEIHRRINIDICLNESIHAVLKNIDKDVYESSSWYGLIEHILHYPDA